MSQVGMMTRLSKLHAAEIIRKAASSAVKAAGHPRSAVALAMDCCLVEV
jgi:hypothetical protein